MTGYTVHTGSSVKFSKGWDRIFGGSKKKSPTNPATNTPQKPKNTKSRKKS